MNLPLTATYLWKRTSLGRQPLFCETHPALLDHLVPNKQDQKYYILRNPVHENCQVGPSMSKHMVNTPRPDFAETGVNHVEGGWAKEINMHDEEQVARYRRKIEKEDAYVSSVFHLVPHINHYLKQNNAIEMYEMYYANMPPQMPVEKVYMSKMCTLFDDFERPVSSIAWSNVEERNLIVAYCDRTYPPTGIFNTKSNEFYLWNIDNPIVPLMTFTPETPCWTVSTPHTDNQWILAGLQDGTTCVYDIRMAGAISVLATPKHFAHRYPTTSALFLSSRTNTEYFSGSTDGLCLWWDVRKMSQPYEEIFLTIRDSTSPPSSANAEPITVLQYDRNIPTRFLCGTDTGYVVNVNRKGKDFNERMSGIFSAHSGAVKALHRSPGMLKVFITCGDWTCHIWSDDVKIGPIIPGTPTKQSINDVSWAPLRYSAYMTVSQDGTLRFWDLLRKHSEPIYSLSLAKHALTKVKPHDDGRLVAIGDANGQIHLVSLSECLAESGPQDKALIQGVFEKCSILSHILEMRQKEIKLKLKIEEEPEVTDMPTAEEKGEQMIRQAEDDYRKTVWETINQTGHQIHGHTAGAGAAATARGKHR